MYIRSITSMCKSQQHDTYKYTNMQICDVISMSRGDHKRDI